MQVTKELVTQRLAMVVSTKDRLLGQLNALVGREAELRELLAEIEKPEEKKKGRKPKAVQEAEAVVDAISDPPAGDE